ncbi:hypothetical protein [Thalassotalea agarivorans]|uniref:VCBS repeat-containing protein n=1 Tax=Thalassotalea agarivorans TaxID=349064 RepID=A0A1I0E0L2_THASX|nr:hypothetical protein [Thalassotalea agarivorans]SET37833.1 VCBS repeat-containing protein [Thalassotalea agarivorans]
MKTFQNKKLLAALAMSSTLVACGSDSDSSGEEAMNNAPVHGGNIVRTFHEKDAFEMLYLLGTPEGKESGEGIAYDPDGDLMSVRKFEADTDDLTGFDVQGTRIGVRPAEIAPFLDSGESKTVTFSYKINDGKSTTARKMTVTITGEDAAPEFSDLEVTFTKFDGLVDIDLLEGVVDADGEPLTISDFAADPSNTVDAHTLLENIKSLDIDSFSDLVAIGEELVLKYSYKVNDHNNSLVRNLTVKIRGVRKEPLPPEIVSTYAGTFTTNDNVEVVDLAHSDYTVEWNGDPVLVDVASITPTNGGPALKFNKSMGSVLVVDPVDFGRYIENVGDTETFEYAFKITDGTEGDTAGHVVDTSFSVTVTKEAPANLILNGSFEDGLNDWTADGSMVSVADSATAWDGAKELSASGWSELVSSSFEVTAGGAYHVSYAEQMGDWGRYNLHIANGADNLITRSFGLHPTFAGPWVDYAIRSLSFEMPIDAAASTREVKIETALNKVDDVQVTRYSTDNSHNLLWVNAGSASVDFEDGTQAAWGGDNIAMSAIPDEVVSGDHSLVISGPAWVALPAGTVQDAKKYLLKLEIKQLEFNQSFGNIVQFQIRDASDWTAFYANPLEHPRSIDLLATPIGEVTTFQQVIDPSRVGQLSGWDTRNIVIEINPTIWGAPGKVAIDNIQLIELD